MALPGIRALYLTEETNGFGLWKMTPISHFELLAYLQEDSDTAKKIFYLKARAWKIRERAFAKAP